MAAWVAGAVIMLAIYVYGLIRTLLGPVRTTETETKALPAVSWSGADVSRQSAWVGPLSVVVLIGAMFVFTVVAFEVMESLPIIATGSGAH